jgi:hypothetical protein
MSYIKISDEAYEEFKSFLEYNSVVSNNLKISYLGRRCSGPVFNISYEDGCESDLSERVGEINFIFSRDLIDEYGGFIILSNTENSGDGLIFKPLKESDCCNCNVCPSV